MGFGPRKGEISKRKKSLIGFEIISIAFFEIIFKIAIQCYRKNNG
jgi:hypothetical protein